MEDRARIPEAEKPEFEPHPPLEDGNVPQEKHEEAKPLVPIVPGC